MNWNDEQRLRRAVRRRDDAALAEAVRRLPGYERDYDQVKRVIDEESGGRLVGFDKIRLGRTIIRNRFGRAEVVEETW